VAFFLAPLVAILISYAWYYFAQLFGTADHGDPQGGWDLVATAFWSLFAVPSAIVALLIALRRASARLRAAP
jgi:TRAP-type mannitol/chloroaromatic compound transport system permease small subunit